MPAYILAPASPKQHKVTFMYGFKLFMGLLELAYYCIAIVWCCAGCGRVVKLEKLLSVRRRGVGAYSVVTFPGFFRVCHSGRRPPEQRYVTEGPLLVCVSLYVVLCVCVQQLLRSCS